MENRDSNRGFEQPEGEPHSRETCTPCRIFDPPWRGGIREAPREHATPFELLEGLFEVIRQAGLREAHAKKLKGEFAPGSMQFQHAEGWRAKLAAERKHFEAERRKWRSYIDAHPAIAHLPISTPCEHAKPGQQPTCWDGEAGLFVRQMGDEADDDELQVGRG